MLVQANPNQRFSPLPQISEAGKKKSAVTDTLMYF
jgi:hypothetical protein